MQVERLPAWAPKVSPGLIRRLYATDALGITDDEQIDTVGWALWQRCDSILAVTAAHYGRARCALCEATIERERAWEPDELLVCPSCDWRLPWARYHQSYRGKQLFGANAVEHFEVYHRAFPQAATARARMLCIDQLIHAFHVSVTAVGRPAAANLIAGSLREVIHLLDSLASGEGSATGLGESRVTWRATLGGAEWARPFLPHEAEEE